jgi:hypothetical protein
MYYFLHSLNDPKELHSLHLTTENLNPTKQQYQTLEAGSQAATLLIPNVSVIL